MNASGPRAIRHLGPLAGGLFLIAVWAFAWWALAGPSTTGRCKPGTAYFVGSLGMLLAGSGAWLAWSSLVALWRARES